MGTPIIPSMKIRKEDTLRRYIRDVYAGYSPRTHVRLATDTNTLHETSSVNITVKRFEDRYGPFYRVYTQKKPNKIMAFSHPVWMERPRKGEK